MKTFYPLQNTIQSYAWGSSDGIPDFTDIPATGKPMAELWMGAHPAASSLLTSASDEKLKSLKQFIEENPEKTMGADAVASFGNRLPYLFKVLSAGSPLSIQVHPSREQAIEGFERENRAGIPVNAPERNYRDNNHKPEIIMALTPFTAMCGFRPQSETIKLFSAVAAPQIAALTERFTRDGSYPIFCESLLDLDAEKKEQTICLFLAKGKELLEKTDDRTMRAAYSLIMELARHYPTDIGILAPLYLNVIDLNPGEAIYLPAKIMHAYIKGTGLELMANSDNVLRCGLTPKHIDKKELFSILSPAPYLPNKIIPSDADVFFAYETESPEFELARLRVKETAYRFTANTPTIIIGAEGTLTAKSNAGDAVVISKGFSAFIPATGAAIDFSGTGTAYLASVPRR